MPIFNYYIPAVQLADQAQIRQARLEDLSKIARLEHRVWAPMAAAADIIKRRFLLFPQGFKVALIGREVAGFCCATITDQDATSTALDEHFPPQHVPRGSFFFLSCLTVNPVYRRNGIGSQLVQHQILTARHRKCHCIQLIGNSYSRALFLKLGFRVRRELPKLFSVFPRQMPHPALLEKQLVSG